jgi:hypothetical protein
MDWLFIGSVFFLIVVVGVVLWAIYSPDRVR